MGKTVYVLGELNADLIMTGEDVTPEWNREKLVDSFETALGSSSAITACGLAGLGLRVRFVSVAGDDQLGAFCMERLREQGVDTAHVAVKPGVRTGVTLSLATGKDRALMTYMGSIPLLAPEDVPDELFEQADHIHFGSYYLQDGMRDAWLDLFRKAKEKGITTSFDMGWDPRGLWHREKVLALLPFTDLFMPSEDELSAMLGCAGVEEALAALPPMNGVAAVKRGARGAVMLTPGGERLDAPAFRVQPVDPTGAGDSFNAGLIFATLSGYGRAEALRFACACGALATTRVGGASSVPGLAQVEQFLAEQGA